MSHAKRLRDTLRKEEAERVLEARTNRKVSDYQRRWGSPSIGESIGKSLAQGVKSLNAMADNYIKKKKYYVVLLTLVLLYFLRGKLSITGYNVIETVTQTNIISPFLVFLIVICIFAYYKLD